MSSLGIVFIEPGTALLENTESYSPFQLLLNSLTSCIVSAGLINFHHHPVIRIPSHKASDHLQTTFETYRPTITQVA